MDGGAWVMWNNWWTTSWTWAQFPNTFNLSAGSHTLTFAFREDGARLDKINLSTSSAAADRHRFNSKQLLGRRNTLCLADNGECRCGSKQHWYVQHYFQHQLDSYRQSIVADSKPGIRFKQWNGNCNGARKHKHVCTHGDRHRFRNRRSITNGHRQHKAAAVAAVACNIPPMPSYASLPTNLFPSGSIHVHEWHTVTTRAEWTCRRAEIAALAQEFEYGYKPNTPSSATTGSRSGNTLTVTVTDNGRTISFNASITYPSTGSAPYPAMIGVGGSNLNNAALSSLGVAVINFPNNEIAQQNGQGSRGVGKFYDMYGSGHSAGALMAWAWGVSRLIDALEKTPAANIDPARLGVTGCSRNGKGALAAGAFDERIKLTIPQESGSGGSGTWRVSDWMLHRDRKHRRCRRSSVRMYGSGRTSISSAARRPSSRLTITPSRTGRASGNTDH